MPMKPQAISIKAQPDLVFCATGKSGLGHLRRITNVVTALHRLQNGLNIHLISNAEVKGLSTDEAAAFNEIHGIDRKDMAEAAGKLGGGLVVVDTAVLPSLGEVKAPLCLILRETIADKLSEFQLQENRKWNLVCVPNLREHWMPTADAVGAKRIEATGWIFRSAPTVTCFRPRVVTKQRRVLVASGGGGNAKTAAWFKQEIDNLLKRTRALATSPIWVTQAIGPRFPEQVILSEANEHTNMGSQLNEKFAQYDVVISTVGYNSVLELAQTDVPVLLVPILRSLDDQAARANGWAIRMGHAYDEADMESSARWLAGTLAEGKRRETCDLGANGAEKCASLILDLL